MKKIILCLFTSLFLNDLTQAQTNSDSTVVKNIEEEQTDLIDRKKQRMVGWVLMGAGFALSAIICGIVQRDRVSNEKR